jgi:hypothetical protein
MSVQLSQTCSQTQHHKKQGITATWVIEEGGGGRALWSWNDRTGETRRVLKRRRNHKTHNELPHKETSCCKAMGPREPVAVLHDLEPKHLAVQPGTQDARARRHCKSHDGRQWRSPLRCTTSANADGPRHRARKTNEHPTKELKGLEVLAQHPRVGSKRRERMRRGNQVRGLARPSVLCGCPGVQHR